MAENWKKKLPNALTLGRVLLTIPVVILLFDANGLNNFLAALFFIIASITDYFDGALARKYKVESNFGKLMDPIADKILVSSVLVVLVAIRRIDPFLVVIILSRDTLVSGIRSIAAADGLIIAAKSTGKWKTALQMVALPLIMLHQSATGEYLHQFSYFILWATVVLSVVSAVQYFVSFQKACKK